LKHATERDRYPEMIYNSVDAESLQETAEGESLIAKPKKKKEPQKQGKKDE